MATDQFTQSQLIKRTQFHELIHAGFILDTPVTFYLNRPQPTPENLDWLAWVYPNSEIEQGEDQGAKYTTITVKL